MAACYCSLAGTAACQHCSNNPFATDVWTNKTVTVDHIEARPFGNGLDVCPVCGKPSTIGKPQTNADRIRSMTDEELAKWFGTRGHACPERWKACNIGIVDHEDDCIPCWLEWLKEEAKDEL